MLIGRTGTYTILSPFDKLGSSIQGKIVELSYIQHELSTGVDVENRVYAKVGAQVIYSADVRADVLLVTIRKNNGDKVRIPDKYIEGLYDDDLTYVTAYLTVKLGPLPSSYDYIAAKEAIARGVKDTVGINVIAKDISVSVSSNNSVMMTAIDATLAEAKRITGISGNISDYGKLLNSQKDNQQLTNKVSSLENMLKKASKYT